MDAATGHQLWKFGSGIEGGNPIAAYRTGRAATTNGSWWASPTSSTPSMRGPEKPIPGFGEEAASTCARIYAASIRGNLGLHQPRHGLQRPDHFRRSRAGNASRASRRIRAYDVRTGELRWSFHTIPHPGEFGYETWPPKAWTYSGGANNWTGMALDEKRGIVYVPTGSAASDFYGADRIGDDLFANSLIALNAETGKRIWHFQTVKHDVWDRDLPSPPSLVTVKHDGRIHRCDRADHQVRICLSLRPHQRKPVFPISYRPYPPSTYAGRKGRCHATACPRCRRRLRGNC